MIEKAHAHHDTVLKQLPSEDSGTMREVLRRLDLFAGMADADLDDLASMAKIVSIPAGRVLMEEGSQGEALYVVLDGDFEISKRTGDRDLTIAQRGNGELLGEIALLGQSPRTATVRAERESRLLCVSHKMFEDLLTHSPRAALAVLRTVTERLEHTEAMLRQSEKMASLGTLSAGLAHELNNPAAAVRRSSAELQPAIAEWLRCALELRARVTGEEGIRCVVRLTAEMERLAGLPPATDLGPLQRSDREGEIEGWLEGVGLDEPWEAAGALVDLGWTPDMLAEMTAPFDRQQLRAVAEWLAAGSTVYSLLSEVQEGADRISEIVAAVKSYSYLDQAPVQLVDVHEGLESTVTILRSKLKQGVKLHRDYDEDLPRIEAYASELNQVWTNLIDNAIDAMGGQGEIWIRTSGGPHEVTVEITDNGPGIPPEVQGRIFDAFYTTKPVGSGTGLGLHISYNIVAQQHHGDIRVHSRPGETTFRVTLPVHFRRQEKEP